MLPMAGYCWEKGNLNLKRSGLQKADFLLYGDVRKMHLIDIEAEAVLVALPNNGIFNFLKSGRLDKQ